MNNFIFNFDAAKHTTSSIMNSIRLFFTKAQYQTHGDYRFKYKVVSGCMYILRMDKIENL